MRPSALDRLELMVAQAESGEINLPDPEPVPLAIIEGARDLSRYPAVEADPEKPPHWRDGEH